MEGEGLQGVSVDISQCLGVRDGEPRRGDDEYRGGGGKFGSLIV